MRLLGCVLMALAACGGHYHLELGGRAHEDPRAALAAEARGQVIAYLVDTGHADPSRRERLAEGERREVEHRLAADAEQAARLEADALQARAHLHAYLVALGAKERPARPAPRPEVAGDPPFPGAEWIAGDWRWEGTDWLWTDGSWVDAAAYVAAEAISVGLAAVADRPTGERGVRDHRSRPVDPPLVIRDQPIVRDHRTGPRDEPPVVRDHRDHRESKHSDPPIVRDHRESKSGSSKRDDDKPQTRDHRRS